jgi:hypothetical protein
LLAGAGAEWSDLLSADAPSHIPLQELSFRSAAEESAVSLIKPVKPTPRQNPSQPHENKRHQSKLKLPINHPQTGKLDTKAESIPKPHRISTKVALFSIFYK